MINPKSILSKLWYGKYTLSRAFWGFFVFGQFAAIFAMLILYMIVFLSVGSFPPAIGVFSLAIITYSFTAAVGVWQSANARRQEAWESGVKYPLLPMLAKIVVLLFVIWSLLTAGARFELIMQMLAA